VPHGLQHGNLRIIVSSYDMVSGTRMELIKLDWTRCLDGYEIRTHSNPSDPFASTTEITAKSNKIELYRPTEFPALFQQFVDKPPSAEGMRDFADRFGLLEGADREIIIETADLDAMLAHRDNMRRVLELFDKGDSVGLVMAFHKGGWGKLRVDLVPDPYGRGRLLPPTDFHRVCRVQPVAARLVSFLVPTSLVQFMWLQIAMYAQSNATLLRCDRCASPFFVGTGTGRRGTAKFCSNACKVADYRDRHRGVQADA
jgi:hypothetical protein